MNEMYYVLCPSEDGLSVTVLDKSALEKRLDDGYWGDRKVVGEIPEDNHNYWGRVLVIIKGQVVKPVPVSVATEWRLP